MRTNEQTEVAEIIIEDLQDYIVLAKAQQKIRDKGRANEMECDLNDIIKLVKDNIEKL